MLLAFSYFHLKVPQSHRISSFSFRSHLRLHLFAHILVSSLYVFHSICYTEENATILYQKHTPPKYCYRLATIVWLTTSAQNEKQQKQKSADRQSVAFNVKAYARPLDLFQKSMTMLLLLCEISYSFGLS